jgi:asparagine synthase (glutamine-hydrolysing)
VGGTSRLLPLTGAEPDPRRAIEAELLDALRRPPCGVAFSGGRDSSVLLAMAVALADRDGLPRPVALTNALAGDAASDDPAWQRRLVDDLGVDWTVFVHDDELDAIGPVAATVLRRTGVVWPAAAFTSQRLLQALRGGSLVTGEYGDELFGDHRVTPVIGTLRRRPRPNRLVLRAVGLALAPASARARDLRAVVVRPRLWLRPEANERHVRDLVADLAATPLGWRRSLDHADRLRSHRLGHRTLHALAAMEDVMLVEPFAEPDVKRSVALAGGRFGWTSRSEAMLALFGGDVPEELLRRTTKARFNRSVIGVHSRAFAESWDGTGLPDDVVDLVDRDALRAEWLSDLPHPGAIGLLQAAWLGSS